MEIASSSLLPVSLVIDLPEVDAQHEEIFIRIESLKAACFDMDYDPIVDFEGLMVFFAHHFATEERIAEQNGVEFSEHMEAHRKSLYVLNRALGEVRGGIRDAYSFLRYIELWFERHINDLDKPLSDSLKPHRYYRSHAMYSGASLY